jgi:hypothetical protein
MLLFPCFNNVVYFNNVYMHMLTGVSMMNLMMARKCQNDSDLCFSSCSTTHIIIIIEREEHYANTRSQHGNLKQHKYRFETTLYLHTLSLFHYSRSNDFNINMGVCFASLSRQPPPSSLNIPHTSGKSSYHI